MNNNKSRKLTKKENKNKSKKLKPLTEKEKAIIARSLSWE